MRARYAVLLNLFGFIGFNEQVVPGYWPENSFRLTFTAVGVCEIMQVFVNCDKYHFKVWCYIIFLPICMIYFCS